jgi:chromosomal replication initiation ATPase DnaA
MKAITEDVAKVFGVTEAQILGPQRWQPLALARQVAMVITLESLPFNTQQQVSAYFRRHRTALVHARTAVLDQISYDQKLAKLVEILRKKHVKGIDELLEIP